MSSLLPPNATVLESAVLESSGLSTLQVPIADLWNPSTCPLAVLPWLAWAVSVDEWDETWTESTQRAVVAAAIEIHRRKGTVGAVRQAMSSLGYRALLTEWFQQVPPGAEHTFLVDVEISDRGLSEATISAIARQIDRTKPARSHYTLRVFVVMRPTIRHACAVLAGDTVDVWPYSVTELTAGPTNGPRHAVALQDWMTTEVLPQ